MITNNWNYFSIYKKKNKNFLIFFYFNYRNGQIVRESSEISTSFDGTTAKLSISNCKITANGSYRVLLVNQFGQEESSAELKVTEKKEKVRYFNKIFTSS